MEVRKPEVKRKVFEENDNFRVDLELIDGALFAHVEVFDTKLSTYKKMRESWSDLVKAAYFDGFEFIFSYTQNRRFADWLGENQFVETVVDPETGEKVDVIYYDMRF